MQILPSLPNLKTETHSPALSGRLHMEGTAMQSNEPMTVGRVEFARLDQRETVNLPKGTSVSENDLAAELRALRNEIRSLRRDLERSRAEGFPDV